MGFKNVGHLSVEEFFDPANGYVYAIVLPCLILFALGERRWAALYGLGAVVFMALSSAA